MSLAHSLAKGLKTEGDTEGACQQWLWQCQRGNLQEHTAHFIGGCMSCQCHLFSKSNDRSKIFILHCMLYELKPRKPQTCSLILV